MLPISEFHESTIIQGWNIQKILIIVNVSGELAYGFHYLWLYYDIDRGSSLADGRQSLYKFVPIGT